ncbi:MULTISPECIES: MFS transporter [unclassified Methylobacterium]|uniref:MFS transporter n=1 Tax=unclassified Methylobacterium TaxID=2615210 RepID=UPI0006F8AA84|nr:MULTISPECIES: MFS transporter [unclassified Methylobacterium]KQP92384.1 MFS transporter [Methylobacterium sp. Leaf113]KQP96039.1 MFS transporter [Methylobacterium sp. Leaf117]MCK2055128.1 MFS transporter [Methylobacterium sp. 37f]
MTLHPSLLALAIGAFGIGVTEFTPMGMLPLIASDLGVSIPTAGLLVSAYALGVLIGAPLMTLGFARMPRRALLVGLMGIFTLGNLLSALADSYTMLLGARIVTSFNHGAFFGIGSVVAAGLVPPERRAAAVAAMFSGLTIATIGGVPLAAWVGEALGWRAAFWGIAGIGVIAMVSLRLALPPLPVADAPDMGSELRVVARAPVLAALALTVLGSSAMFTVFTYIVPILRIEAGAGAAFVSAMLVIYGVGLTVGNWAGGRLADRSVDGTIMASLLALIVLLLLFAPGMTSRLSAAPLIFLWGIASFALVPPLQMRVMAEADRAPNLASALNIGAFNLGNAIGAALGGGVIDLGWGYPAVSVAGAAMAALGLALIVVLRRGRRIAVATACP